MLYQINGCYESNFAEIVFSYKNTNVIINEDGIIICYRRKWSKKNKERIMQTYFFPLMFASQMKMQAFLSETWYEL